MRLEQLFAISDFRYHVAKGGKAPFDQLIRYHDPEEPGEVTLEQIAQRLGAPYEVRTHG